MSPDPASTYKAVFFSTGSAFSSVVGRYSSRYLAHVSWASDILPDLVVGDCNGMCENGDARGKGDP